MLVAGVTLTARTLWGRQFSDIPVYLTLYDGGKPVAAVVGQNSVSPDTCGAGDLRKRFTDWDVHLASNHTRRGWVFYAIIHLPSVDKAEFLRIVIDGAKTNHRPSPRTNPHWTPELRQEMQAVNDKIDGLKIEMAGLPRGSAAWQEIYQNCGAQMKRRGELNRIRFGQYHQGGRPV